MQRGFYASQYTGYSDDETEIRAIEYRTTHTLYDPENPNQSWWPRSADFLAAAEAWAGPRSTLAAPTFNAMFRSIVEGRSLTEVRLFTHGARGEIQFGRGRPLTVQSARSIPDLSGCFATGGRIVFYACNVQHSSQGPGADILQAIADQARVQVCGFDRGVRYSISWNGQREITSRGVDSSWRGREVCRSPQ